MTHFLHSVQRLPQELVRKVADELVGIKEWVTIPGKDPPPPTAGEYYSPEPPLRKIDFIGLRTMPSLATVCHIFLEPTLDALWPWATLPDYGILVYLLPKDAWAVDVIDDMGDPFLSPEERSPLFQYVVSRSSILLVEYTTNPCLLVNSSLAHRGRVRTSRVLHPSRQAYPRALSPISLSFSRFCHIRVLCPCRVRPPLDT